MVLAKLSYRSVPNAPIERNEFEQIVLQAQKRNLEAQLTGLLVYDGGYLMHSLEGPVEALVHCFWRIKRDRRHRQVLPFGVGPLTSRKFEEPCMSVYMPRSDLQQPQFMHCFPYTKRDLLEAMHVYWLNSLKRRTTTFTPPLLLGAIND